jgi:hypothetical protein
MVRTRALFCLIACGAGIGIGAQATALAATVHLRAPDECAQGDDIVAEVDSLIGRPLSEIPGMKFEVEIARSAGGKFRLRLDTTEGAQTRTRELAGQSCAELANVASVAIAMTIRASAASREPTPSGRIESASPPVRPMRNPVSASAEAGAAGDSSAGWRSSITLAAVADAGALPRAAPGGALELAIDAGSLRIVALGALFATERADVAGGGGEFDLALGGVLGCFRRGIKRVTALACLGTEIGRLSGRGLGVSFSRFGSELWLAPRADVGIAVPLVARLVLVLRGGATAPVFRPEFTEFVSGEAIVVHQAARVTARATLGVEVGF